MVVQSRKWLITLNNYMDYGVNLSFVKQCFSSLKNVDYYCYSQEIGEQGTPHIHIFVYRQNPIRFDTLKKRFPKAHFDVAKGTCSENRDYVFKIGKWANDVKSETNIADSHYEFGELPVERQGSRNDLADLYDLVVAGASDIDIITDNPNFLLHLDKLDKIRQAYREKQFSNVFRKLDVTYIYGGAGVGKTRTVMEQYGYSNVYRVTDYTHPFDYYKGEDVIVFDEFRSSLKISDMLNYLDGYPLMLPCRYNNKVACYTKVFIISNIILSDQYLSVQKSEFETFKAFIRRINNIYQFSKFGKIKKFFDDNFNLISDLNGSFSLPLLEDLGVVKDITDTET